MCQFTGHRTHRDPARAGLGNAERLCHGQLLLFGPALRAPGAAARCPTRGSGHGTVIGPTARRHYRWDPSGPGLRGEYGTPDPPRARRAAPVR